jgi:hypothetical protein
MTRKGKFKKILEHPLLNVVKDLIFLIFFEKKGKEEILRRLQKDNVDLLKC